MSLRKRGNPHLNSRKGKPDDSESNRLNNQKNMMKPYEAAHLVDKNSRTMTKILQLLEIMQLPGAAAKDKHGLVQHRIDQLKRRLNRRLIKLAKWADIPQDERQPKERISALRTIVPVSASGINSYQNAVYKPAVPVAAAPPSLSPSQPLLSVVPPVEPPVVPPIVATSHVLQRPVHAIIGAASSQLTEDAIKSAQAEAMEMAAKCISMDVEKPESN